MNSVSFPADSKMQINKRWVGRVALVTGVCNSTGKAVAESLSHYGMYVVGVDDCMELEKLDVMVDALKSEGCFFQIIRCDIRSADNVKKLFTTIKTDPDIEGVDVVIHCAVAAFGESILEGNPILWREMWETNVLGPALVTQEAYKTMKDRQVDDGHIIFNMGLLSHRIIPGNKSLHFLSATKFAMRALLEGLRYELRLDNTHISVSGISPGVIETDFLQKLFEGNEEHAKSFLGEKKYLDVKDVAAAVIYILEQPPHVQIHDILMRSTDQIP